MSSASLPEQPLRSESVFDHMVELRREIHRHPELAFHERETAKLIMRELDRLGIEYSYGGEGGGVVGRLKGGGAAPVVALRAEMDALPGAERTDLPFSSEESGRMHACGHDAHMAMVLGAAALLKENPPPQGDVWFVFQPAEEKGGGSRVVINSGELEGVSAIFGGHVTHHYSIGEIMVASGVITAQSDRFEIRIRGKGGHGARPHEATDAIVITGLLIATIQTLVSREIDPIHPSVVTVGQIEAGSAANVIAENAVLRGTIRTTLPAVRDQIHSGLQRIATATAALHNAEVEVDFEFGYPPVVNTSRETEIAARAVEAVLGRDGVAQMDHPSMGSEDFSYYLEKMPGCYVRFGARQFDDEYVPLHSPAFNIDEGVLKVGAAYFDELARQGLDEYCES